MSGGATRWHVLYRLGGRSTSVRYGGSFKAKRDAETRRDWVRGEFAAQRVPDLALLAAPDLRPTFADAAEHWRASRIDATDATRVVHRVALQRAMPLLGELALDEITTDDGIRLVASLSDAGAKRGTIRKTLMYARAVLDEAEVDPNPLRDKRVRLPYEEVAEIVPPEAEHVEAVYRTLPRVHRLPLVWLDWSGARVGSVDLLLVGDYDETRSRIRIRREISKTRRGLWVDLAPELAAALSASLGPREDRDPAARLFPASGADALRTSIAKACRALGVPPFSPHDLRHRRISVLHAQGQTLAQAAAFVGSKKLSITADTYTHVLVEAREIDLAELLA
jgi:integrase